MYHLTYLISIHFTSIHPENKTSPRFKSQIGKKINKTISNPRAQLQMSSPKPSIDDEAVVFASTPPTPQPTQRPKGKMCEYCGVNKPQVIRPKTGDKVCKDCFCYQFEEEVHYTITTNNLFKTGQRVVLGASGGKDSTVLIHVMTTLNKRHNYGLDLQLLSIDEGIQGYRDDSLGTVKRNQDEYSLPLKIISYAEIYRGWTMDKIVKAIGQKNNCTFCGVFRRQALDRGAQLLGADMLLTGHNCDDIAETVFLNILRGDIQRAGRCVAIITGKTSSLPRAKPLKYCYEKEIVMYAYLLKLDYFATECKYAPFAFRGYAREFIKDLERIRPRSIVDIVVAAEYFQTPSEQSTKAGKCLQCGYLSAQSQCKACQLLDALDTGVAGTVQSRKKVTKSDSSGKNDEHKTNKKKDDMLGGKACGGDSDEEEDGQQSCVGGNCGNDQQCCDTKDQQCCDAQDQSNKQGNCCGGE
jgi:cytoplasmic tRNA 2-thiolation protein 1